MAGLCRRHHLQRQVCSGGRDFEVILAVQKPREHAIVQIEEWKSEKVIALEENEVEKNSFGKEPIKLGVLVAPQTISNSTQSINMGAGLMSEFSISKNQ